MKNKVWIEQYCNGKFYSIKEKYLLLIPFIGIKILNSESLLSADPYQSSQIFNENGWLLGGTIIPTTLEDTKEVVIIDSVHLHTLNIDVQQIETPTKLRFTLGFEEIELKTFWSEEINRFIEFFSFINVCLNRAISPNRYLFEKIYESIKSDELIIQNFELDGKMLTILNLYFANGRSSMLSSMKLSNVNLIDNQMDYLNLFLCKTVFLKTLDLSRNNLSSDSFNQLSDGIRFCSFLEALDISHNNLTDDNCELWISEISNLKKLKFVNLSNNNLGDKFILTFVGYFGSFSSKLEYIDLSCNSFQFEINRLFQLLHALPPRIVFFNISETNGNNLLDNIYLIKSLENRNILNEINLSGIHLGPLFINQLIDIFQIQSVSKLSNLKIIFSGISKFLHYYPLLKASFTKLSDFIRFQDVYMFKRNSYDYIIEFNFREDSLYHFNDLILLMTKHFNLNFQSVQLVFLNLNNKSSSVKFSFENKSDFDIIRGYFQGSVLNHNLFDYLRIYKIGFVEYPGSSFLENDESSLLVKCNDFQEDFSFPLSANINQYSNDFITDNIFENEINFEYSCWVDNVSIDQLLYCENPESDIDHNSFKSLDLPDIQFKRETNDKLIFATRKLYETKEITSTVAKFWEGMFGNKKYRKFSEKELLKTMHQTRSPEDKESRIYIFPAILERENIYESMFSRNLDSLKLNLDQSSRTTGGFAFYYGEKLYRELMNLKESFMKIKSLIRGFSDIYLVEDFLAQCGQLSYHGSEMFEAIEIRKNILVNALEVGNLQAKQELSNIKKRAMITNFLISRDLSNFMGKVESIEPNSSTFNNINNSNVFILSEYERCQKLLNEMNKTRNIQTFDEVLALCAYYNFHDLPIEKALKSLENACRNPAILMKPILVGLRNNDMAMVEKSFNDINGLGLKSKVLDPVVCSKIHALKNKIIQDDSIKDKIIKTCLALRNGFDIPSGEILQLYRQAIHLKLDSDSTMKQYFKILLKFSKRLVSVQKQEKYLQFLIESNNALSLSKFISGRGNGKLFISFQNIYILNQWFTKLESVSKGLYDTLDKEKFKKVPGQDNDFIIFEGYLEKSARKKKLVDTINFNAINLQTKWKSRYFVLTNRVLNYFTKPGGNLKGSFRIINCGMRILSKNEIPGKPFLIELEEGRDITNISPDLLNEAKRIVKLAKILEIETILKKARQLKSAQLLQKMFNFAKDLEVIIDYNLFNDCKTLLTSLKTDTILKDLLTSQYVLPKKFVLKELLEKSKELLLETNLTGFRRLIFCVSKTEIEYDIIRCSSLLQYQSLSQFLKTIQQILEKKNIQGLPDQYKSKVITMTFQYICILLFNRIKCGFNFIFLQKLFKLLLSWSLTYFVELEVMGLIRLALLINPINNFRSTIFYISTTNNSQNHIFELMKGLLEQTNDSQDQFNILKYPKLRVSETIKNFGFQNLYSSIHGKKSKKKHSLNSGKQPDHILSFTKSLMTKSLQQFSDIELKDNFDSLAIEIFKLIQVLIHIKPLSLVRNFKKSLVLTKAPTFLSIILDLMNILNSKGSLIDEFYLQISKQLNNNDNLDSLLFGWKILNIFLNFTSPSSDLLPYFRSFVNSSLQFYENIHHRYRLDLESLSSRSDYSRVSGDFPNLQEKIEDYLSIKYILQLINYSIFQLLVSEKELMISNPQKLFISNTISQSHEHLLQHIISDELFLFEVYLLSGEKFTLSVPYGKCYNARSLLLYIFEKIIPEKLLLEFSFNNKIITRKFEKEDIFLINEYDSQFNRQQTQEDSRFSYSKSGLFVNDDENFNETKDSLLTTYFSDLLSGFALYSLNLDDNDNVSECEVFARIPFTPDHSKFISWDKNLFFLNSVEESPRNSKFILRQQISNPNEDLFLKMNFFEKEISNSDYIAYQEHWKTWLLNDNLFPYNVLRVDLLFSEDTRLVNSNSLLMSTDHFHYLLALQLALSWSREGKVLGDISREIQRPTVKYENSKGIDQKSNFTRHIDILETRWINNSENRWTNLSLLSSFLDSFPKFLINDKSLEEKLSLTKNLGSHNHIDIETNEVDEISLDSDFDDKNAKIQKKRRYLHFGVNDDSDSESNNSNSDFSENTHNSHEKDVDHETLYYLHQWQPSLIKKNQEITIYDLQFIYELLKGLGINIETQSIQIEKLWEYLSGFHSLAIELNISLLSPKYRYYLKCAYHSYLTTICPFYGQYYYNCNLLNFNLRENIACLDNYKDQLKELSLINLIISISSQGLFLFNQEDWSIVLFSYFYDIQNIELIDDSSISFQINGLELIFHSFKVIEIYDILKLHVESSLSQGNYPFGTLDNKYHKTSVNNFENFSFSQNHILYPNEILDQFKHYSESKIQSFLLNFSLLPQPPNFDYCNDYIVHKHFKLYISLPQSKREILARQRAEEEELENEINKLAELSLVEKNQSQITKGRKEINNYRNTEKKIIIEDDDENDLEEENENPTFSVSKLDSKSKSKRKHLSLFNNNTSIEELSKQIKNERSNFLSCGTISSSSLNSSSFSTFIHKNAKIPQLHYYNSLIPVKTKSTFQSDIPLLNNLLDFSPSENPIFKKLSFISPIDISRNPNFKSKFHLDSTQQITTSKLLNNENFNDRSIVPFQDLNLLSNPADFKLSIDPYSTGISYLSSFQAKRRENLTENNLYFDSNEQ